MGSRARGTGNQSLSRRMSPSIYLSELHSETHSILSAQLLTPLQAVLKTESQPILIAFPHHHHFHLLQRFTASQAVLHTVPIPVCTVCSGHTETNKPTNQKATSSAQAVLRVWISSTGQLHLHHGINELCKLTHWGTKAGLPACR